MIEIIQASDNNKNKWMEYVNSHPKAHFYHDYRWRKVIEESFGHKCFYLTAEENGKTLGAFPMVFINGRIMAPALISIPFFNYGGILAESQAIEAFLLDKAVGILKETRAAYIEIRSPKKLNLLLVTREHKVTMHIEILNNIDEQWGKLEAKLRNQVRKAEKSGLTVRHGKIELLDNFYRVFARNMRDLGTPVLGRIFFANILKYFSEESNIFIVEFQNKPIAGAFTLCHTDTLEIPWASSVKAFNKFCPNEFMYWELINYAISKGLKRFDFGRCTKESGTYRFKKQWGPEIKQLYWQYCVARETDLPADDPQHSRSRPLIALWKRLPLFISNSLGPHIAKNIPIF